MSHVELMALADARAARLADCGIRRGDLVGLCLPNGCEWVVAYLALARLQACCVPLNAVSAVAEVAHVVRDCGMRALFVSADRAEALEEACADRVLLYPDGAVPRARPAPERESGQAAPAGAACLAYTSGTTGTPKGVIQTWLAVRADGSNLARRLRVGPRDRVVTALPPAHTYGTNVMNAALGSGADRLLLEHFDAEAMLERSARPHQSLRQRSPDTDPAVPAPIIDLAGRRIKRRLVLGGLINEYEVAWANPQTCRSTPRPYFRAVHARLP